MNFGPEDIKLAVVGLVGGLALMAYTTLRLVELYRNWKKQ